VCVLDGDCRFICRFCVVFLAADLFIGRVKALLNLRPSFGMADTMDRNIWDIMGEVKPSVNSGPCMSGVADSADPKSLSTKKPA